MAQLDSSSFGCRFSSAGPTDLHLLCRRKKAVKSVYTEEHSNSPSESKHALRSASPAAATPHSKPLEATLWREDFMNLLPRSSQGISKAWLSFLREPASTVTEQALLKLQSENGPREQICDPVDLEDMSLPVSGVQARRKHVEPDLAHQPAVFFTRLLASDKGEMGFNAYSVLRRWLSSLISW